MPAFGPFVELFAIHGINMLGNFDSGAVVGLTPAAARACGEVLAGRADVAEIAQVDEGLHAFLDKEGFFAQGPRFDCLQSAYVHVTQRCNLDCKGCYSAGPVRNNTPDPSLHDLRRAFTQLARMGVGNVNISGGEPFLRSDLCEIARIANAECGIASVGIVTNGTVAARFDLGDLANWVSLVTVSIDGPNSSAPAFIRGSQRFDALMETVGRLKESGVPVRILPTLHARNVDDVPAYMRLAERLETGLRFSLLSYPPGGGAYPSLPSRPKASGAWCSSSRRRRPATARAPRALASVRETRSTSI